MTRRWIAGLLAAAAVLAFPGQALAHAVLLHTTPANGAVLATAPREARFVFDDVVRVAPGIRAVRNGGESVLAAAPHVVAAKTLVVPLGRLGDGDYTVLWRIVSDDGHNESGVISFAVGAGRSPPVPSLSAQNGPTARDVVSRWLLFGGLLVAAGGALFRVTTGAGRPLLLFPAFVAVFLGASGLLPHEGTLSSRFGVAYAVAALLAGLGAAAAAASVAVPRVGGAVWVFALALLPLPSVAGHALDPGRPRIEVIVDLLHLAAAALWTGGLVQLAFALRSEPGRTELLRRFSNVAVAAVGVLAVTGVVRALAELRSVTQVWSTGYGQLLIAKTGLLGALVVIGWINRYRLVPRGDARRLRGTVRAELVLLTGLVVAVAILTAARPGRDVARASTAAPIASPPPLPGRSAVVDARQDGSLAVAVAVTQKGAKVTVRDGNGLGAAALRVSIFGLRAMPCGSGCYEVAGHAGAEPIVVDIDGRRLKFRLPHEAPSAAALVARATRRFSALRSVTYRERLASDPTHVINTTFTLEAPNRLAYRIHGGAAAVVIGARRWDTAPDNTWARSQTTSLPQPTPVWSGPVRNAHLIGHNRTTLAVTFLNPNIPAWFHVDFDRATLLPRTVRMTAPAHFMFHRYVAYNRPRRIFPPRG